MAANFGGLGVAVAATANHNPPAGQIKLVREKTDQHLIGLAFDGRRGDTHFETPAMQSRDLGAPRIGLHMQDKRQQAASRIVPIP